MHILNISIPAVSVWTPPDTQGEASHPAQSTGQNHTFLPRQDQDRPRCVFTASTHTWNWSYHSILGSGDWYAPCPTSLGQQTPRDSL